jgi:hypothetical protein
MSANTPILQQILSELQGVKYDIREIRTDIVSLRQEVSTIRSDMTVLRNDFTVFRDNTVFNFRNLSRIQEKTDAEFFRQYLNNKFPTMVIESHVFGNFYLPNGSTLTDIDGCVSLHTIPQIPNTSVYKPNNSKYIVKELIRNEMFILESKGLLDIVQLNKKIIQFCKIIQTIQTINKMNMTKAASNFKEMIVSYPLFRRPNKIYFMMCANDMSLLIRTFIREINNNTLDKNKYLKLIYEMFLEHPNYKLYKGMIKEHPKLKKRYEECQSFDEMKKILQMPVFKDHAEFIGAYFYPYESMDQYYKNMAGIIGYIFQENVYLPNSF